MAVCCGVEIISSLTLFELSLIPESFRIAMVIVEYLIKYYNQER